MAMIQENNLRLSSRGTSLVLVPTVALMSG